MKKRQFKIMGYIGIVVISAVIIPAAIAASDRQSEKHYAKTTSGKSHNDHALKCQVSVTTDMLEKLHSGHFPMVMKSIDKALSALEAGDKKTARLELRKAKMMMSLMDKMIAMYIKPKFVNIKCPIMGTPINPDKVAKNLIREYKGQKVAFCCGGCPAKWDKLSDAEKDAKLAKVKPAPENVWTCPMHQEVKKSEQGACPICNMKLIPDKK